MSLKEKLKEDLASKGQVAISSHDVGEFTAAANEKPPEAKSGDVEVLVPPGAVIDPLVSTGAEGDPGRVLQHKERANAKLEKAATAMTEDGMLPDPVVLTETERNLFLEAIVSGERLVLPFTLFDGKIKGELRSRKQAESHAVIQQINRDCNNGIVTSALDYATRLRNMLLAAQIQELNGEAYVPLATPLLQTVAGEKTTPAGWLDQIDVWSQKEEGLVSALYKELQKFEQKYWAMVEGANDQDFWHPEESTSK